MILGDSRILPCEYSFEKKKDKKKFEKMRFNFLPIKNTLQEWPLTMLLLSALYRCYVADCCPYINAIWDLFFFYEDGDLQSKSSNTNTVQSISSKIKNLNANQFDAALLQCSFPFKTFDTQEQVNSLKKVTVSHRSFWGQIFTYIFFAENEFALATSIFQEFKAFAERNSYFKVEFPNLAIQLLYKVKYSRLFLRKERFTPNQWDLVLVFISLQVFSLLELLGVSSEKAKMGICLTVKENNIKALRVALEEIYGPINILQF